MATKAILNAFNQLKKRKNSLKIKKTCACFSLAVPKQKKRRSENLFDISQSL